MKITLPRGDIRQITFMVESADGIPYDGEITEIYFTVKRYYSEKAAILQKKLSTGEIISDGDGQYHFTLYPEDTDNLQFTKYAFDIEIVGGSTLKQTFVGELELTMEVTHAGNEG